MMKLMLVRLHCRFAVCALLLSLAPLAPAADEATPTTGKPKSVPAIAAIARADLAVAEAETAYRAAVVRARRREADELKAAQEAAMKAGTLREANAIDAEIKRLRALIESLNKGERLPRLGATNLAAYIERHRLYDYEWIGKGNRRMDLLPDGKIGVGAAGREHDWRIEADGGEEVLIISGAVGPLVLRQQDDGTFRGEWTDHDGGAGVRVILRPVSP